MGGKEILLLRRWEEKAAETSGLIQKVTEAVEEKLQKALRYDEATMQNVFAHAERLLEALNNYEKLRQSSNKPPPSTMEELIAGLNEASEVHFLKPGDKFTQEVGKEKREFQVEVILPPGQGLSPSSLEKLPKGGSFIIEGLNAWDMPPTETGEEFLPGLYIFIQVD